MLEPIDKALHCHGAFRAGLRVDELGKYGLGLADVLADNFQALAIVHGKETQRTLRRSARKAPPRWGVEAGPTFTQRDTIGGLGELALPSESSNFGSQNSFLLAACDGFVGFANGVRQPLHFGRPALLTLVCDRISDLVRLNYDSVHEGATAPANYGGWHRYDTRHGTPRLAQSEEKI
jgi:hypothetical protein